MTRFSLTARALAAAALFVLAMPAGISTASTVSPAGETAILTNLLTNESFETGWNPWTHTGTAKIKTFSATVWPTQAYANGYDGGTKYLWCGATGGSVSQTVAFDRGSRTNVLKARLSTNWGGVAGNKIRVSVTFLNGSQELLTASNLKVLDVTNHYKVAVIANAIPMNTNFIRATIDLIKKDGASKCKVLADSVDLHLMNGGS